MFPREPCEVLGVSVDNGVGDQPHGDAATFQGALTRAEAATRVAPDADYCVGMEGGVIDANEEMGSCAWIVVRSKNGKIGKGRTGTFFLPHRVAALVREGKELGDADDMVFGHTNSKQQMGAVGILTKNVVTRTSYYTEAVVMALIPFVNPELY